MTDNDDRMTDNDDRMTDNDSGMTDNDSEMAAAGDWLRAPAAILCCAKRSPRCAIRPRIGNAGVLR